ncbi:MAG: hypothetical protein ACRDQ4_10365 [Pseudonocardiaceae bacterium]
MRRSSEPEERAQFTVAELLARYGEVAPTTGRRHRRAAEDAHPTADTAAQPAVAPVVERNWVGTGDPDLFRSYSPQHDSTASTQPHLNGRAGRGWTPAVGPPSVVAGRVPVPSPLVARRPPLNWTALPDGPVTDQLPRLDPVSVDPVAPAPRAIPERNENAAADAAQAREPGSPLWEWAVMVSQIGIGVVGGAALWLICEWLWQRIPVVALVVALAVITGLVWVVRRVRCAEDLQTTVIAVLVGLFVTVSPAALLLVGR